MTREQLLKEGQGIATWRGRDEQGREVVIRYGPAALQREAEALARLGRGLRFGRTEQGCYLVRDYVPGESLRERLARGPLPIPEWLQLAGRVLEQLEEAHAAGLLHRDVKPENIIGDTLIDFGLARTSQQLRYFREAPAGTPLYMSPEQAGLLRHEVGERSDLYSLGLVLYEAACGQLARRGKTLGEALRAHLVQIPPLEGFPRALQAVVARLTQPDPRRRYARAGLARADLEELAGSLARGHDPQPPVGRLSGFLQEPGLVNRHAERELLQLRWAEVREQRTVAPVVLLADSGAGKTRLLDEVGIELGAGARIFRGQAVDAPYPFSLLQGVVHSLRMQVSLDPPYEERVLCRLGSWRGNLASLFASAAEWLGAEGSPGGPERLGPARTIHTLEVLFGALGEPEHPALVLLDDAQWAEELVREFLRGLRAQHLLVVVATRESSGSWGELEQLPLRALRQDEVALLASSMVGELPPAALETVGRLSDGSPFQAVETIRGLVEAGALVAQSDRWSWRPDVHPRASLRAATTLERRIEQLEPGVRDTLSRAALLGKTFSVRELELLAAEETAPSLLRGRAQHFLWSLETERYQFVHDRIREAFLQRLTPELRRQLHLQVARHLESQDPLPVFELAFHFRHAGEARAGFVYALEAARQARRRVSLETAEVMYRTALEGMSEPAWESELREGLGIALMGQGRLDDARSHLQAALELREAPGERCGLLGTLGYLEYRAGNLPAGVAALEQGLKELGWGLPRSALGEVFGLLKLLVVRRQPPPEVSRLLQSLLEVIAFTDDARWTRVLWCGLAGFAGSTRPLPPTAALAHSYFLACTPHLPSRWFMWSNARACAVDVERYEPFVRSQVRGCISTVYFYQDHVEQALELADQGLAEIQPTGDVFQFNNLAFHAALYRLATGDRAEATRLARRILSRHGDYLNAAAARFILAYCGQQPPPPTGGEAMGMVRCLDNLTRGFEHLRRGEYPQALPWFQAAERSPMTVFPFFCKTLSALGRVATALAWARSAEPAEARLLAQRARPWLRSLQGWVGQYPVVVRFLERELEEQRQPVPEASPRLALAQLDRFEELLAAGQELAGCEQPEDVLACLVQSTRRLLRAPRVLWLEEGSPEASQPLVERCLRSRRTVHLEEWPTQPLTDSQVLAPPRSLLCAPVIADGRAVGVLYAEHDTLERLFGPEEGQLMTFLVGLGGAALENARALQARRRADEELRQSREHFDEIFRAAAVGMALVSAEGEILLHNPALAEMTGRSLEGASFASLLWEHPTLTEGLHLVRYLRGDGVLWGRLTVTRSEARWVCTLADASQEFLEELVLWEEEESQWLATELHDGLAQDLAAEALVANNDELRALLNEDLRDLLQELSSPLLQGVSLVAAVETLLDPEVEWTPPHASPTGAPACLAYRLLQQALGPDVTACGLRWGSTLEGWVRGTAEPLEPSLLLWLDLWGGTVETTAEGLRFSIRI